MARDEMDQAIQAAAGYWSGRRVAVLTGAGVSAESGIPPFGHPMVGRPSHRIMARQMAFAEIPNSCGISGNHRANAAREPTRPRFTRPAGTSLPTSSRPERGRSASTGRKQCVLEVHGGLRRTACTECRRSGQTSILAGNAHVWALRRAVAARTSSGSGDTSVRDLGKKRWRPSRPAMCSWWSAQRRCSSGCRIDQPRTSPRTIGWARAAGNGNEANLTRTVASDADVGLYGPPGQRCRGYWTFSANRTTTSS